MLGTHQANADHADTDWHSLLPVIDKGGSTRQVAVGK